MTTAKRAANVRPGRATSSPKRSPIPAEHPLIPTDSRHVPWRLIGFGAGTVPAPVALSLTHPALGLLLALAEIGAATLLALVFGMTLLRAILRGSDATTERCFRLLRWIAIRPEHPAPSSSTP